MFFKIDESIIKQLSSSTLVFDRGYWLVKNVGSFEYIESRNSIDAVVEVNTTYHVTVDFAQDGEVKNYSCECPAYQTFGGVCKHIVAVMFVSLDRLENIVPNLPVLDETDISLPPLLELNQKSTPSILANMAVACDFRSFYVTPHANISLRVGLGKLYIVKSIYSWIESIDDNIPQIFGKNFTYFPSKCFFPSPFDNVLRLINDIYTDELSLLSITNQYVYSFSRPPSCFNGRFLRLTSRNLCSFLQAIEGAPFMVYLNGEPHGICTVVNKNLPIELNLKEQNNQLILENISSSEFLPLTKNYEFVLDKNNNTIYSIPKENRDFWKLLFNSQIKLKTKTFAIPQNSHDILVSEIIPSIQNTATLSMDKSIQDRIIDHELLPRLYFDRYETGIQALVKFCYGEHEINPLAADVSFKCIVLRNYDRESSICECLLSSGFMPQGEYYVLFDEDKIAHFILEQLDLLKNTTEIYYADSFKSLQLKTIRHIVCAFRINQNSNLLDFSMEIDHLDPDELFLIFASIREKKKYHRLKSGSFISLASSELRQISELVDSLSITPESLSGNHFSLPINKALFAHQYVQQNNMNFVEKNEGFKQLVSSILEPQDMDFELPSSLKGFMRDYQCFGFKWLKTLAHFKLGGILADDMGLGKTLQILSLILSEKEDTPSPSIVIAPTSLIYNWFEESQKFTPTLKVLVVSGMKKEREELISEIGNHDIVVTSYASLRRDIEMYANQDFKYCIIDEAQHIKNPSTLNAATVKSIKASVYFALTGTPIENTLTELWSIFDFVLPGYLFSHNKFVDKFEKPIVRDNDKNAVDLLSNYIRPFILRRLKKDVLKELPEKIQTKVTATMDEEQTKLYFAYLQNAKAEFLHELSTRGMDRSHIKVLALLTRLRQLCCHPSLFVDNYQYGSGKLDLLIELIEDSIQSNHRCLVFSQFTKMHDIIKKSLEKLSISYFYLDGATSAMDRITFVKRFNQGERSVFLISLKAGGTGLNLTGADVVIHYDPWWNPAVEDQATDRAYRIGQDKVVQVFKLITKGTIEEKIFELQENKRNLIDNIIRPGESLINKLGEAEIRELFGLVD